MTESSKPTETLAWHPAEQLGRQYPKLNPKPQTELTRLPLPAPGQADPAEPADGRLTPPMPPAAKDQW